MRILVIDDKKKNIESAYDTLENHEVTTADSIERAWEILESNQEFDAVLTDLHLPRGDWTGAVSHREVEEINSLPAGLVFALKAANERTRTVIYTDKHHHNDWICGLLDLVGYVSPYKDRGAELVAYVEADVYDGSAKDWNRALVSSGLFRAEGFGSKHSL